MPVSPDRLSRANTIVPWLGSLALGLMLMMGCASVRAVDLTAYTEEWPPYNYQEHGQIKGITTDILRAVCATAELSCAIEMVPWARAYQTAREKPNTLVYTTARKPSRENEFLWVGPLLPRSTWVYGRTGTEKIVNELKHLAHVRIGVVRGEASQQDLEAVGVPTTAIYPDSSNAKVLRLLTSRIVDAMVDTEIGMAWNLRILEVPAASVSRLMKLSDEGAYYFAVNRDTDPALVRKLQYALDKLRREGRVDAIIREYTAARR